MHKCNIDLIFFSLLVLHNFYKLSYAKVFQLEKKYKKEIVELKGIYVKALLNVLVTPYL